MKYYGTGINGLAILTDRQSEKDEYKEDVWLNQPMFRHALPSEADRRNTLRIALRAFTDEPFDAEATEEARPAVFDLLAEKGIRAVVAVGKTPFKLLTRRNGAEDSRVGSVIPADPQDGSWVCVPVHPGWKLEGELLLRLHARFIRRAFVLAKGGKPFAWQKLHVDADRDAYDALCRIWDRGLPVGVDIETAGIDILKVPITAMGIGDKYDSVSVPWETYEAGKYGVVHGIHTYGEVGEAIQGMVLKILRGPQTKILHNGAYDSLGLRKRGIVMGGSIEDTILQHRVCFPERTHGLQTAAVGEFPAEPWKADFKTDIGDFIENDAQAMRVYNAKDTAIEPWLYEALDRRLYEVHNGHALYAEYKELAAIAGKMQEVGMRVDRARAIELKWELEWNLGVLFYYWAQLMPWWTDAKGVIRPALLGKTGATAGVRLYFLESLKAPVVAKSKITDQAAVPAAALLEYRALARATGNKELEDAAQINFYYRKNAKLLTAFVEKLAEQNRVHTTFNVWGTKGARWSAKQPNLMQISKDKVELIDNGPGQKPTKILITPNIRDLFQADEGMVLVEADYSQLELREVAYFSEMTEVLDWLEQDRREPGSCDPHTMHARMMFGDPTITKSDKRRDLTKTLTYALFYNYYQGVETVYKALKPSFPTLTLKYLEKVQKLFYKARPQLPMWQESIARFGTEHGYIEAPLSGRRLYQPGPKPDINMWLSFPVQSTGGDVCNGAVRAISPQLDWESGEHIKIQVHDALIAQCRPERVQEVAHLMRLAMERPVSIYEKTVSFPVDVKAGPDWKNMKDLPA